MLIFGLKNMKLVTVKNFKVSNSILTDVYYNKYWLIAKSIFVTKTL